MLEIGVPVLDRRVGVCRGRFVVLLLLLVVGVDGLPALLNAGVVLAVLLPFLLSKAPAEAAAPPMPPCDAFVSVLVVHFITALVAVLEPTGAEEAAAATETEDEDVPEAAAAADSPLPRRARSILSRCLLRSSSSSDELIGDLVGYLLA